MGKRNIILPAMIILTLAGLTGESAWAQQGLFGQRTLGRSLARRATSQTQGTSAGSSSQSSRFLRDQRAATDFVGSSAANVTGTGFVGAQSAVTSAVSSVAGLSEEVRSPLNRPRILRPTGLYAERLSIDESSLGANGRIETETSTLSKSLWAITESRGVTIEVSQANHSATLRGVVPSEDDRKTTELLVMLEPGIQTVVNDLKVDPSLPPYPPRRRRDSVFETN